MAARYDGLADLRTALLAWFDEHARDLPWRRDPSPWVVLVSEVMLQQTQAARVAAALPPFLERHPTPAAMAAAPAGDVIRDWSGLGYNRRALRLHACARALVERHGGRVPAELGQLLALPGVGAYTARAVAAFAHGRREAPVDTNVARVLSRALAGTPLGPRRLQTLADEAVPPARAAAWSSALMDLGATTCTARAPRCTSCPIVAACRWRAGGGPDPAAASAHRARRQGTFEGSSRQRRGRLLEALRSGPVPCDDLRPLLGPAGADTAAALCADGLAVVRGGALHLPGGD